MIQVLYTVVSTATAYMSRPRQVHAMRVPATRTEQEAVLEWARSAGAHIEHVPGDEPILVLFGEHGRAVHPGDFLILDEGTIVSMSAERFEAAYETPRTRTGRRAAQPKQVAA